VPTPIDEMADRGVRPPSFIREFGGVNEPGRMVGKISPQKEESGQAQKSSQEEENPMQPTFREISPR
jgi:hypothetical protein